MHWKSHHVRRSILFPVAPIKRSHTPIGNQHQAQFRRLDAGNRQHGLGRPAQPGTVDGHGALTVLQEDGH
ncbi:MAG: hypothetical protein A3K11_09975 [Nitrospirae bacterium RIFCSPLOWO2_12_FULL_63_8]|nr:MAG: hypothetical protein A3K11_09975 [Nitrospirae bacterium RIFCSPLOWO2_12_FULL_63_8]